MTLSSKMYLASAFITLLMAWHGYALGQSGGGTIPGGTVPPTPTYTDAPTSEPAPTDTPTVVPTDTPTPTPTVPATETAKSNLTVHIFLDVNGDGHPFKDIFLPGYELVVTDTIGEEYLLVTDWRGQASIIGLHPGHWYIYTGNVDPYHALIQPGANLHVQVGINVVSSLHLSPIYGEGDDNQERN